MLETDWERFNKGEATKETLLAIAGTGSLLLTALLAPGLAGLTGKLLRSYQHDQERHTLHRFRERMRNIVRRLENRRLVEIRHDTDGYLLLLTEEGKQIVKRCELEKVTIPKPARWDGRWRIVGFDIAETHKSARDALRDLLKRLEFYPLQKSLWIYPYPCREEIEIIRYAYALGKELWFCETDTIDQEPQLLGYFGLLSEAAKLLSSLKMK